MSKKKSWPSRENLLLKFNNKMDLPMSCLSSNTQHGAGTGATGQAQHSNINASSDGSNNNNTTTTVVTVVLVGEEAKLAYLIGQVRPPSATEAVRQRKRGERERAGEREREGEWERQREAQTESKSKSVDDGVDYGLFSNLFSYSPPFYFLEVATAASKLCGVIAMAAAAEQSSSRSQIYRLEWEQQRQLDGTGPDPRVGVHSATISTSRCL